MAKAKQNYKYEIIFRMEYLDEDMKETGQATEAILFQTETDEIVCVADNMTINTLIDHGRRVFSMTMEIEK